MKTYLDITEAEIRDGRKIKVYSYKNVNKTLHQANVLGSKLLLWMMNCDSNNASSVMRPSDCEVINQQWQLRTEHLKLAFTLRDQLQSTIEETYEILLPDEDEMLKFPNQKLEIVANQIRQSILASMGIDSAGLQMYLDDDEFQKIMHSNDASKAMIDKYIGTGLKNPDGSFDTGAKMPSLKELGQTIPDVDMNRASLNEPGPDPHELNISAKEPNQE